MDRKRMRVEGDILNRGIIFPVSEEIRLATWGITSQSLVYRPHGVTSRLVLHRVRLLPYPLFDASPPYASRFRSALGLRRLLQQSLPCSLVYGGGLVLSYQKVYDRESCS